jgi:hypothetical protein
VFLKGADGWSTHKSAYSKLRRGKEKVLNLLEKQVYGSYRVRRTEDS